MFCLLIFPYSFVCLFVSVRLWENLCRRAYPSTSLETAAERIGYKKLDYYNLDWKQLFKQLREVSLFDMFCGQLSCLSI